MLWLNKIVLAYELYDKTVDYYEFKGWKVSRYNIT